MRQLMTIVLGGLLASFTTGAWAGLYSGPTDTTNAIDPAIPSGSSLFVEWADEILPLGSGTYFAPGGSTGISTTGFNCLGDLTTEEISAGDSPGYLTVSFPHGIFNGSGADFAVFENGFPYGSPNGLFAELAYVEVSTDAIHFARFSSISTNTEPVQGSGAFAGYDMSNVFNLAGKHASGYGTPFDLDDLLTDDLVVNDLVDLDNIQYVRLVDIPGNGSFLDNEGHGILDNWLTTGTGGYDFQLSVGKGVGVINAVPEPGTFALLIAAVSAGLVCLGRRQRAC